MTKYSFDSFISKITSNFIIILSFICLTVVSALSQDEVLVQDFLYEVNKLGYSDNRKLVNSSNPSLVLDLLEKELNSSSKDVRYYTLSACFRVFKKNKNSALIKRRVVDYLVSACSDNDTYIRQKASKLLHEFSHQDFSYENKISLMKLLEPEYITTHTILLAGVANLSDQKRILYNSIGNWKGGYDRNAWFAKLALARMGDEEQIKSCITAIENEKDTDYRMLLMEYIAFMRQPQAFDILVKYLFSEMKTDTSGTVCSMSIKHAYSILPYLVSGIKNFPIEEKESYTEEDLLAARNWIKINANYAIIR